LRRENCWSNSGDYSQQRHRDSCRGSIPPLSILYLDVKEYKLKWPNYCQTCNGWGGSTYTYDPSPKGVGLSSGYMIETEPCSDCIDAFICPRCGAYNEAWLRNADTTSPCENCGFEEMETEGLPEEPECYCWYEKSCEQFDSYYPSEE
jgi:predicted RNA-binding Zn-ribbon protein involved in translation (DUF1610 family)